MGSLCPRNAGFFSPHVKESSVGELLVIGISLLSIVGGHLMIQCVKNNEINNELITVLGFGENPNTSNSTKQHPVGDD